MNLKGESVCHSFTAAERIKGIWSVQNTSAGKDDQILQRLIAALGKKTRKV